MNILQAKFHNTHTKSLKELDNFIGPIKPLKNYDILSMSNHNQTIEGFDGSKGSLKTIEGFDGVRKSNSRIIFFVLLGIIIVDSVFCVYKS